MKFCVSALVGVIIKVILQNAQCNNKETFVFFVKYVIISMACVFLDRCVLVVFIIFLK